MSGATCGSISYENGSHTRCYLRKATSLKQKQYIAVADTPHQDACMCVHITLCNFIGLPLLDVPPCPNVQGKRPPASNFCSVSVTWQQPPNTPPDTFTTVTYLPSGDSMNCTTNPCSTIIIGLDSGTEYQFTVIPNNICGSPTGCTENMTTVTTLGE